MNLKVTLFTASLLTSLMSLAQNPGTLDTSFGTNGKTTTDLYGYQEIFNMAIQSDGKSVLVGRSKTGSNYNFCVFRYNTNGTIDTSFGTNGATSIDMKGNGGFDEARAIVIQPDGKIVVGGSAGLETNNGTCHFGLVRLNTNGTLDTTFGTAGKTSFPVGTSTSPDNRIYNLTLQPDGKIIAIGEASSPGTFDDFAIVRLNTDGSLDSDFSNDGKTTVSFVNLNDKALKTLLQPDGKIIVAGSASSDLGIVRFFDDGSIDTSFGTNGKILLETSETDFSFTLSNLEFQADGKIILLGTVSGDVALRRINVDGTIDTTFGVNGKVKTDIDNTSTDSGSTGLLIQPDGNIIATAMCSTGSVNYFGILRYTSAGVLDNTFSNDGKVLTNFLSGFNTATSVALQADGKLLVSGFTGFTGQTHSAIARYNTGVNLGTSIFDATTIKVYPNPTLNEVNIESTIIDLTNQNYSVVDQIGKTVLLGKLNNQINNKIDLSQLNSGVYFIKIANAAFKVVKQ